MNSQLPTEPRCANQMSGVRIADRPKTLARKGKTGRSRKTLPAPIRQVVRQVGCPSGMPERRVAFVKSNGSAMPPPPGCILAGLRRDHRAPSSWCIPPTLRRDLRRTARACCLSKGIGGKRVRRCLHSAVQLGSCRRHALTVCLSAQRVTSRRSASQGTRGGAALTTPSTHESSLDKKGKTGRSRKTLPAPTRQVV